MVADANGSPAATIAAFASQGEDLFGASEQFRSWLSCRAPACAFDLLVLRYETLGEALGSNKSLESLIESEMSGNLKKCLQALLLPPADYFAMRLKQAFKGLGTSDRVVCRVLGGHDKPDAIAIAKAYRRRRRNLRLGRALRRPPARPAAARRS